MASTPPELKQARRLPVAVLPEEGPDWMSRAAGEGGGELVAASAEAVIWGGGAPKELSRALQAAPQVHWVQLPAAGIEAYRSLLNDGRTWTSGTGVFGEQVAEHAQLPHHAAHRESPAA